MRKRIRTMVLAAGTAAVAVAVGVTSAAASMATWTVTPGGSSTCGFSLVNSSDNGGGMVLIKHLNSNPTKLVILARGGNLRIFNVSGSPCDSLFNNGDAATLAGRITLSTGQTITSP